MDIGAWLRRLGLGQYEQPFRDHDIDAEVLPELTADDLSGLGVASIGHRRKLLATIAALAKGTPSPEIPPAQTGPMPSIAGRLPVPRSTDAERRQPRAAPPARTSRCPRSPKSWTYAMYCKAACSNPAIAST